jgi:hypothetical protein
MPTPHKQRLHKTITALQGKHGAEIIDTGPSLLQRLLAPPHISTGFPCLDALTGCKGIPIGHLTLLTGRTTSGKLTLSYSILANAQGTSAQRKDKVAILDVVGTSNPDYIVRRGVDLNHTLFVRPPRPEHAVQLLFDLLRSYGLKVLLVNGLGSLLVSRQITHAFDAVLPRITQALRSARCALVCLDEPDPPWLRTRGVSSALPHQLSLHLEFERLGWLTDAGAEQNRAITGCVSRAHLIKSRWAPTDRTCDVPVRLDDGADAQMF